VLGGKHNSAESGECPVTNCCEHGNEPSDSTKASSSLGSWATISVSRKTLHLRVR